MPLRVALLVLLLVCSGCVSMRPIPAPRAAAAKRPVLLVHGIDDTGASLRPLAEHLTAGGWTALQAIDLTPNDGAQGISRLAEQIDRHARALSERTGAAEIDIVAFSMGSLVTRYWLRRMSPSVKVHTFISISGPHHGTFSGYFRWNEGATQMRPGSPLVRDLERDEGEWDGVQVYSFWSPYDLMIFPAKSSRLKGAVERTFPVALHPLMLYDRRVHLAVSEALEGRLSAEQPFAAPAWP